MHRLLDDLKPIILLKRRLISIHLLCEQKFLVNDIFHGHLGLLLQSHRVNDPVRIYIEFFDNLLGLLAARVYLLLASDEVLVQRAAIQLLMQLVNLELLLD